MKYRFLVLWIVLSIVVSMTLCACNSSDSQTPTENITGSDNASTDATDPTEAVADPTDKGLFVTEPEEFDFTLPSGMQGIALPEVDLEEDAFLPIVSAPVDETLPERETTTPEDTEPEYNNGPTLGLPEDEFE